MHLHVRSRELTVVVYSIFQAARRIHVNIVELMDTQGIPDGVVRTFGAEKKLAKYTQETELFYPRKLVGKGDILEFFLRRVRSLFVEQEVFLQMYHGEKGARKVISDNIRFNRLSILHRLDPARLEAVSNKQGWLSTIYEQKGNLSITIKGDLGSVSEERSEVDERIKRKRNE